MKTKTKTTLKIKDLVWNDGIAETPFPYSYRIGPSYDNDAIIVTIWSRSNAFAAEFIETVGQFNCMDVAEYAAQIHFELAIKGCLS